MEILIAGRIKLNRLVVGISLFSFAVSLTQECYCTSEICGDSLPVFFVGILGIFYGGATLVWLANPLIFLAWIFTFRNSKFALPVSIVATSICLSFLLFERIIDDEAGNIHEIISYQLGYWLWSASAAILTIGNAIGIILSRQKA